MLCKQCGAQIRKEHKKADGIYQCPDCGKMYRLKSSSAAGGKAPAGKKAKRGVDKRLLIGGVALLLVLAILLVILVPGGEDKKAAAPVETAVPTVEATAAPTPVPTATAEPIQAASVHFRAVGDIMSHKLQLRHAKEQGSYDPQFQYVKDALTNADFTIGNLELSIATDNEYSSFPFFRTPEIILDTLKDCGIDMFTVANNHILDGFWDGLVKTLDELDERGFDHVGADRSREEAAQPMIRDINGIRFGFLAYTKDTNENEKRLKNGEADFCVKYLDEANFKKDVQELRDLGAEVVICMPHWGIEEKRSVTGECKRYAQEMVDAGVDIILGSHPHVVLPINVGEMDVNGEKKDVLIAWSMGNFISYMAAKYMDSGIIVDFTVTRDETGKISIHDVGYVPVYVWGNTERFHLICSGDFYSNQPDKMSDSDFKRMRQSVKEISDMIGNGNGVTMLQH